MRRKLLFTVLLLLVLLVSSAAPAFGQEADQPLVVFVLNPDLEVSSVFNSGPEGISALDQIFQSLGAETQVVNLVSPIPAGADVIVLVGPQRRLDILSVARIWVHLARGKHLLLTLDPLGYGGNDSEDFRSGLLNLIANVYGLITHDSFVMETGFTRSSIGLLSGAFLYTRPDVVRHPIVAPLIDYDLPVTVWAARSLQVEPIGIDSIGIPLLQTSTAYGEVNRDVFALEDPALLEVNIENDLQGVLNIAGLGQNTFGGSRIVVIGDSQVLQNGYGLSTVPGSMQPRHPGNALFAQRLAAWLIGLPESDWPELPADQTWIALDGSSADWPADLPVLVEERNQSVNAAFDIQRLIAFQNDAYLYGLIGTIGTPRPTTLVEVTLSNGLVLRFTPEQVVSVTPLGNQPVPDARLAVASVLEMRLPLRLLGADVTIDSICLFDNTDPAAPEQQDCTTSEIDITTVDESEPFDLRFYSGALATVTSIRDIRLSSQPDNTSANGAPVSVGQVLSVAGRNAAADWLLVRTAGYEGWLPASLVIINTDISALPVIQS